MTSDCDLNFQLYENAKYSMIGMVGLTPQNIQEERDAILALLDSNRNVEQVITENLWREQPCYIIEKDFWDSWTDNVSLRGNQSSFNTRSEKKTMIDNLRLIEEGHQYRLKDDLNLNEDYVVLPKFVFKALSSWYSCNLVIERAVIRRKAR